MPAEPGPGLDHDHYAWSPITSRPALRWPSGDGLAISVMVVLEHLEWDPPDGSITTRTKPGGLGVPIPYPDYVSHTHREYGHRVGIFRLLDMLEQSGFTPSAAIDALTIERYPWLAEHVVERGCEIVGHGVSLSRMISQRMSEEEELDYIARSVDTLVGLTGRVPEGWFGIEYNESTRTPGLLAQAGIRYICDWCNDDQPYAMDYTVAGGNDPLVSLPVALEADDSFVMGQRRVEVGTYGSTLIEMAEIMGVESAGAETQARHLLITLRPWLSGQPFRTRILAPTFERLATMGGTIPATGTEITQWFRDTQSSAPG